MAQQTLLWLTALFFCYGRTRNQIFVVEGFSSSTSSSFIPRTGTLLAGRSGSGSGLGLGLGGISNHPTTTKSTTTTTTTTTIRLLRQDEETTSTATTTTKTINDEAARLKKEAEMMRLQAEKMDLSLTLTKIDTLEKKLSNKSWIEKYPQKGAELKQQLQRLQDKLLNNNNNNNKKNKESDSTTSSTTTSSSSSSSSSLTGSSSKTIDTTPSTTTTSTSTNSDNNKLASSSSTKTTTNQPKIVIPPILGFDDSDLELYIPVAKDINKMMVNETLEERLEAFRTAPELQAHFQEKIQKMLVGPLEDMQKVESLKQDYLQSTSSVERERLKREIDQLESGIQDDNVIAYTDSIYCGDDLPPLTEEALKERVEAINTLPDILVAIYKQRNKVQDDDDSEDNDNIELAIQMDYYEPQLQLLEQVPSIEPITDEIREEFRKGYDSLPEPVQERFVENFGGFDPDIYGPDYYYDSDDVLDKLVDDAAALSGLLEVVKEAKGIGGTSSAVEDLPEYNDIEFVDRSRFLEEFFPSIANMESDHPSVEDVEIFANKVISRTHFMVTSKPERVLGGYYIRGTNLLTDDEDGSKTAAEKLVDRVTEALGKNSSLAEKLDFFYILDPAPPTDEELELGTDGKPIFLVTGKNPVKLYKTAAPLTKTVTSLLSVFSAFMFSVGSCAFNPVIKNRVDDALETAKATGIIDLEWLTQLIFPLFLSLCAIQLVHEIAHRIVAAVYKFDVGLPNFIPSISTGITGAITPLRSPPPSTKAMFDFGYSGPVAGLLVSLALLLVGLNLTASMEMDVPLPVVPVGLIRASSLGGGLVRYFLGTGVARPDLDPTQMVNLHPFAISGLVGCIINSLALLPLGHTDGGRVSLAMFGRRGSFVVKLFTTLILCLLGVVGLDDENIFLAYILFVSVWQRELETPSKNEVDELDFPRGLLGISAAIAVSLVLIPMF